MTDQEINEEVARKLGWKQIPPGRDTSTGYWVREALHDERGRVVRPKKFPFLPGYCHSIEAAWEIVERQTYWRMYKDKENYGHGDKIGVLCIFGIQQTIDFFEAWADTAPMAICKAFLKLP